VNVTAFRSFAARSVLANATAGAAVPTELSSGTDGFVLRQSGTTLSFGTLGASSIPALDATFWTSTSNANLANEVNIGALAAGILGHTVALGVSTPIRIVESTGLTLSSPNLTVNLSTGIAGGQSAIGGTAASENLTLSSTSHATKGQIRFGGATNYVDETTGDIRFGAGPWIAGSRVFQLSRDINQAVHFVTTNTNTGASASCGFVMSQDSTLGANPYAAFSLFSANYSTVSIRNSVLFDLGQSSGDMIFSNLAAATGAIYFTTNAARNERMRIANGGNVSIANLTAGGVTYATAATGVLKIGTAAEVAAAITWPTINQVLFSAGTTSAPIGEAGFTFIPSANLLAIGAGYAQGWFNLGNDGSGTFEEVGAFWSSNVWNLKSLTSGGSVRSMNIDADTATLTLNGATVNVTATGTVTASGATVLAGGTSSTIIGVSGATPLITINQLGSNPLNVRVDASQTIASVAGTVFDGFQVVAQTLTLTGGTSVTTATGVNGTSFEVFTINGNAQAKTVAEAATVSIAGAPLGTNSATLTKAYAFWVQGGLARFGGNGTHVFELPADATAGADVTIDGRIPILVAGATKYIRYYAD
jgi:hypothetical protein